MKRDHVLLDLHPSALISPDYCGQQRTLHALPKGYGGKGGKWAQGVLDLALAHDCGSILDFGCGEGGLLRNLRALLETKGKTGRFRLAEYDPAVEGKDDLPTFADLIVVTDVLEHVEHDRLDFVLKYLRLLARKAVFVVIATRPSNKTLPDGRNAHLTVESNDWWIEKLIAAGFSILPDAPVSPLDKPSREYVAVLKP